MTVTDSREGALRSPDKAPAPAGAARPSRHRLRVPREHGGLLAEPPPQAALELVSTNHALLCGRRENVQGRTLERLRDWTRREALAAAETYTAELLDEPPPAADPQQPIVVGGHQPSLFHAGVWIKNFAIGELAARSGGSAVNLVIDNDAMSSASIRVPDGGRENPQWTSVPFDDERPSLPWEEASVINRRLFDRFGRQAADLMSKWGVRPLLEQLWPDAMARIDRTGLLRDALTAGRHRLERRWGLANLELPISRMCELEPFLWFAGHILAHLPRFQQVHNQVLAAYRRTNRIRSQSHPVPELKIADGDWIEAPFWVWRKGAGVRGRVFARQSARHVELSAAGEVFARLPLTPDMDACCAVEVLREMASRGIRFRTRALTTTLFARLCLSDLFVHGIGGARYDEMTDAIIERFFGMPAPGFLTLSATLHPALASPHDVTPADRRRLRSLLRDLRDNPQRHLTIGLDAAVDALIAEKKHLIAAQHASLTSGQTRSQRRKQTESNHRRYLRFREIRRQLAAGLGEQRARVEEELRTAARLLHANSRLLDREYAFCLFPEERIRPFMHIEF